MAKSKAGWYKILEDFDYVPKTNVVQTFAAGTVRSLTSGAAEKGLSLSKIEKTTKPKSGEENG